jgi:hypothetical protein
MPRPTLRPMPVPVTLDEYRQITAENDRLVDYFQSAREQAYRRWLAADRALYRAVPPRVWIALPSRKISIGFSTGDWGGGCHALHVVEDGNPLKKLEHQSYYP